MRRLNYEYIKSTADIARIRRILGEGVSPIQFDTETTGLDFITDKILLYQFGTSHQQFVIDNRFVPITAFKDILEDPNRAKLLHNSKYDYQMLKGEGITMEGARDTMLAEYCITAGLTKFGRDLETVCAKYTGVKLDKEMQDTFIGLHDNVEFSQRQLEYAAMDVTLLQTIILAQWEILKKEGLTDTARLEFQVMPAFADMEYYGISIDKEQWLSNISSSEKGLVEVIKKLDDWAVACRFAYRDLSGRTGINWSSQQQMLKMFRLLWPHMPDTKDSTLEEFSLKHGHPVLELAREFRDLAKQTGTYGAAYLEHIHPKTGRIHPKFNQYGAATGRPTGREPNMLNIPRDKKYRSAFVAPPGYDIHTKDYSGCELRIVASMSGDKAMCEAYNKGMDLHTYVASKFMRKDYDELSKLVAAKDPEACDIRQACKSLNFGGH